MQNQESEVELVVLGPTQKKARKWISWLIIVLLGLAAIIGPHLTRQSGQPRGGTVSRQSNSGAK